MSPEISTGEVSIIRCMELAGVPASQRDRIEAIGNQILHAWNGQTERMAQTRKYEPAEWVLGAIVAGLKTSILLQHFLEQEAGRGDNASGEMIEGGYGRHTAVPEAKLQEVADVIRSERDA